MNRSLRIGEWRFTPALHRLERGDELHVLRPKLVQLLECLAEAPGRVLERDELLERVWPGLVVTDDSITRGISELRKLLGDSADAPRYVETIRKGGYRLIADVEWDPVEASSLPETPSPPRPRRVRRTLVVSGGAVGVLLLIALVGQGLVGQELVESGRDPAPSSRAIVAEPTPFTTLVGRETDPAISPDGTRVAFAWGGVRSDNYDIWIQDVGADGPRRVTDDPAAEIHPAWSPDGSRVAFLRSAQEGSGVFVVSAAGGVAERLVETHDWVSGLDWSPDGAALVFAARNGDRRGLRIERLALGERRAVAVSRPPAQHTDHSPVFSPDGSRIAFVRSALGPGSDRILVMDLEGEPDAESRTYDVERYGIRGLEWVADEGSIVLAAEVGGTARLFRLRLDDGSMTRVPVFEEQVTYPSLSRDGRTLVYEDARARKRLHRVHLGEDGASALEPILATTHTDHDPAYSPDGSRIAFVSDRSGTDELWSADPDGSRPLRWTESGDDQVEQPHWSPDGSQLAFVRRARSSYGVWWVDVGARADRGRQVTESESALRLSGWSGDGRSLYLSILEGEVWQARRVDLATGTAREVRPGALVARESPAGDWLYYSTASARGIWRAPRSGGEAELVLASHDPEAIDWSLTDSGLLYAEVTERSVGARLLDPVTRESRLLLDVPGWHPSRLALSPAGDQLILSMVRAEGSDLNLVRGLSLF